MEIKVDSSKIASQLASLSSALKKLNAAFRELENSFSCFSEISRKMETAVLRSMRQKTNISKLVGKNKRHDENGSSCFVPLPNSYSKRIGFCSENKRRRKEKL